MTLRYALSLVILVVAILPAPSFAGLPIEVVESTVVVQPGQLAKVAARCPRHTVLVGGGFAAASVFDIVSNLAEPANVWIVQARNNAPQPVAVSAHAVCLTWGGASVEFVDQSISVGSGSIHESTSVNARCTSGRVVGGGFGWATYPNVHASMPLHGGWTTSAANTSGSPTPLVSSVLCLRNTPGLELSFHRKEVQLTTSSRVDVTCPNGSTRLGGGYWVPPTVMVSASRPLANGWRVWATPVTSDAASARAIVVCGKAETASSTTSDNEDGRLIVRRGESVAAHQATFDRVVARGYTPIYVRGEVLGDEVRITTIYEKLDGPAPFLLRGLISDEDFVKETQRMDLAGLRLVMSNSFLVRGRAHLSVLWRK